MFIEPRHDLDEIAGPGPVIELGGEDAVPSVAAGARRSRQAEDIGGAGDAGGGAALDRRGADLGDTQHVKRDGKSLHPFFEQRLDRLRRHVAAGEAGAAGGDDGIDLWVGDPSLDDDADRVDVVDDDLARREQVTARNHALGQRRAGFVVGKGAGVGNRQHRDVKRDEFPCFVDGGHYSEPLSSLHVLSLIHI